MKQSFARLYATLCRFLAPAILALTCTVHSTAWAQIDFTLPPFAPIVTVAPAVAEPGLPRVITISGVWPNSCSPTNAVVVEGAPDNLTPVVIVMPIAPDPGSVCFSALKAYSFSLPFTPTATGVRQVRVTSSTGLLLSEGKMTTQSATQPHSVIDLTGVWGDAASSGSGLLIQHAHDGSDVLFGGWFLYDEQGQPRWYTLQGGHWVSPTMLISTLRENTAAPGTCNRGLPCPRPSNSGRQVGVVTLNVLGGNQIRVDATTLEGGDIVVPLFSSTLTRLQF